jgi:class 3 adenylate cyclase
VHAGPCLAVDANGQVDYFGRTVNIAARVESIAGPDEVVLSWVVAADRVVAAFVEECARGGDVVANDQRAVKGVDGEVAIVRIGVKP